MSVRMNIVMTDDLKGRLDTVCEQTEQTMSDTMRKATVLYLEAHERTADGKTKIGFMNPDGTFSEIFNL